MTLRARSCLVLGLLLLVGCGRDTAVLTGNVTFEGKPLTYGMVAVRRDDGRSSSGRIEENGTYRIAEAPIGIVQIMVQTITPPTPVVPPGTKGETVKATPTPQFIIPERYNDFEKSGISTTVNPGENRYDLNLVK